MDRSLLFSRRSHSSDVIVVVVFVVVVIIIIIVTRLSRKLSRNSLRFARQRELTDGNRSPASQRVTRWTRFEFIYTRLVTTCYRTHTLYSARGRAPRETRSLTRGVCRFFNRPNDLLSSTWRAARYFRLRNPFLLSLRP